MLKLVVIMIVCSANKLSFYYPSSPTFSLIPLYYAPLSFLYPT